MDDTNEVVALLKRIDIKLDGLIAQRTIQRYYSVSQFAERVNKSCFTIRQHCINRRIVAEKRQTGRGRSLEWMIPHQSLEVYLSEGLLPDERRSQDHE